jgi:radical SAM superfamily enzyme YgiQ (UPF0313 family)
MLLRVSSLVDKAVEHPQFFNPPYPLKYMQAYLCQYKEIEIHLLDCWIQMMDVDQMFEYARKARPDLVVVSATSFDIDIANRFVASLKRQKSAPLIIGIGQGHYLNRDTDLGHKAGYDAILLGEPEQELFNLFGRIRNGNAHDTTWRSYYKKCYQEGKRFLVKDPDKLPFPSYTPEELRAYKTIYPVQLSKRVVWGHLIATRGCPHGCMFCSEVMRVSIGKKVRSRSAANVADEMAHLTRQGVNVVSFNDDTFSANRHFVQSFCEELISRNSQLAWIARVRVDELDYDMLVRMKRAGCIMLGIGVESGCQHIVEAMHKQRRPRAWLDQCRQVFRWTRRLGIGTNAYYVIGNPNETREEIKQTIKFARELNSDSIQVHFYTPYPGSAAWELYKERLADFDPARMFHYATPMFTLSDVSVHELVKLRSKFYRCYIFRPGFVVDHMRKHARFYWNNRDVFWSLLGIRKIL